MDESKPPTGYTVVPFHRRCGDRNGDIVAGLKGHRFQAIGFVASFVGVGDQPIERKLVQITFDIHTIETPTGIHWTKRLRNKILI